MRYCVGFSQILSSPWWCCVAESHLLRVYTCMLAHFLATRVSCPVICCEVLCIAQFIFAICPHAHCIMYITVCLCVYKEYYTDGSLFCTG